MLTAMYYGVNVTVNMHGSLIEIQAELFHLCHNHYFTKAWAQMHHVHQVHTDKTCSHTAEHMHSQSLIHSWKVLAAGRVTDSVVQEGQAVRNENMSACVFKVVQVAVLTQQSAPCLHASPSR